MNYDQHDIQNGIVKFR